MVVFFPERMEVMGVQPRLQGESKRGSPRVGNKAGGKAPNLRKLFLPLSVWGFHHISRFVLKTTVIA